MEGLVCRVRLDGKKSTHASEFKFMGCSLDESGTDEGEQCRKGSSWREATSEIGSREGATSLQHEYEGVLQEDLLLPVLMEGSDSSVVGAGGQHLGSVMRRTSNSQVRLERCGVRNGWMKAFSRGLVIVKEWRIY